MLIIPGILLFRRTFLWKKNKFNKLFLIFALTFLLGNNISVFASEYENYSDTQIRAEYEEAVQLEDIAKQEALIEEAQKRLDADRIASGVDPTIIPDRNAMMPFGNATYERILNTYFKKITWLSRDIGWSLSLNPNLLAIYDNYGNYKHSTVWEAITETYAYDYRWAWRNMGTMYDQYLCHYRYGGNKTPWNIEPDKTSINPILCN